MSGDLADPDKSIPLGTFLAVGISIVVYFSVAVLFAAAIPNRILTEDYGAMRSVSAIGFFINAGVIAATLSSAMASFMGAPRILQSLAADRIFTMLKPFAKVSEPSGNPRRGVLLCAGIAFFTIALGQLNLLASVFSMFFLISYGLLNYATYFEARTQSPAFRPRFKWFSPTLSLMGFIICLAAAQDHAHARDWRLQLIVFTQNFDCRGPLLTVAGWIEGGSGFTEAVQIVQGEGPAGRKARDAAQRELAAVIASGRHAMFPLTICALDYAQAMGILIQSAGIGPLRPNTVVVNWLGESAKAFSGIGDYNYVKNLRLIFRRGKNLAGTDTR